VIQYQSTSFDTPLFRATAPFFRLASDFMVGHEFSFREGLFRPRAAIFFPFCFAGLLFDESAKVEKIVFVDVFAFVGASRYHGCFSFSLRRFSRISHAIREVRFPGIERGYFQRLAPGSVSLFPAIGKPCVEVVCRPRREIHHQLHEVELRIHFVPAATAGQAVARARARPVPSKPVNSPD